MKKKLLTIALGLATTVAIGQIEAGTKFLGGELSYYSNNNKTENTNGGVTNTSEIPSSSFSLIPSFGYMFADNMGAGLRVGLNNNSFGPDTNKNKVNMTVVGLFGRYYIQVAGDKLYFHTDLILDFGFGTDKTEQKSGGTTTTTETDLNSLQIGLSPGWDYFVGEKWAIELNWGWLGYTSYKTTSEFTGGEDINTSTSFGLDFDFTSVRLGARWYF